MNSQNTQTEQQALEALKQRRQEALAKLNNLTEKRQNLHRPSSELAYQIGHHQSIIDGLDAAIEVTEEHIKQNALDDQKKRLIQLTNKLDAESSEYLEALELLGEILQ